MNITAAQLKQFAPTARQDIVDAIVSNWPYASASLTTPLRVEHFFAQIGDESGGLRSTEESLYYTSAAQLMRTWPTIFKTVGQATPYVRNPKELAIHVYGGRMGNAPSPSTDGWDYRGGGLLQDTGRNAYRANGHEADPQTIRQPVAAFKDAIDWWTKNDCNAFADRDDIVGLTRHINGGLIGLADRQAYLRRARIVWPSSMETPAAAPVPITRLVASSAVLTAPQPAPSAPETTLDVTPEVVQMVQEHLKELGYTEVGNPDGNLSDMTETAILAFRKEHGLPIVPTIDEPMVTELMVASPRVMSDERANATPSQVRSVVPEARETFRGKVVSGVLGLIGAVGAAVNGIAQNFGAAQDYIAPVQGFFSEVPMWAWFVVILGIAAVLFYQMHKAGANSTAAYQSGARR